MAIEMPAPDGLGVAIAEVLGIDTKTVHRLIVDCQACQFPMVYIEMHGSEEVLDLDWAKGLKGAEIKILDKPPEKPQVVSKRSRAIHGEWGY